MTITSRRNILLAGAGAAILPIVSCTNGAIDPQKVADAIKTACGIAVPIATVTSIINAAVGATVQFIVDLVCTGYTTAKAANKLGAEPAKGSTVHFVVVVNGKPIEVDAVVQ